MVFITRCLLPEYTRSLDQRYGLIERTPKDIESKSYESYYLEL